MPEIVRELSITPPLSATSDDPNMAEKMALAKEPPLSVSSDDGPAGEIAPAGDIPEADKAAKEKDEAAKKQAKGEQNPPGEDGETPPVKEHKEDQTPPWMKAFISKTKNAEAEARREAAEAKRQLAQALEAMQKLVPQAQAAPVKPEPKRPIQSQFDDPSAYTEALAEYAEAKAEWAAEARTEAKMAEFRKTEADKQAKVDADRAESERQAFLDKGRAKYDDFSEKCEVDSLTITPIMYEAAKEAEGGEDIMYYLGDNPKEARRIASLKPVQQVREIAKLEAQIAEPPEKNKEPEKPKAPTKAPAPITPVRSNNAVSKTPEQESANEYILRRRREEAAKKGIILP